MKNFSIMIAFALAGCINAPGAQHKPAPRPSVPVGAAKPAVIDTAAPASDGLANLETLTFDCPRAGLNAAAREAAKVPSQGTYQFSYFRILNDAHHASYEVHFSSNYVGEPRLRYCVFIYCQQGWNPGTTRVDVRSMNDEAPCSAHADAARRR